MGVAMFQRIGPLLVLPLLFAGCLVRSLEPVYTDKDLIAMPAVEGTWKAEEAGDNTFAFIRDGEKYQLTSTEDGVSFVAEAHFAKIGKRTYLDLTFNESAFQGTDEKTLDTTARSYIQSVTFLSTPVHLFYQVEVANNVFRMRTMNHEWAKSRREKGRLWIDHVAQGDSTLLTADTARVQRFLRRWENSDDAWGEWEDRPLIPAVATAK